MLLPQTKENIRVTSVEGFMKRTLCRQLDERPMTTRRTTPHDIENETYLHGELGAAIAGVAFRLRAAGAVDVGVKRFERRSIILEVQVLCDGAIDRLVHAEPFESVYAHTRWFGCS